MPPDTVLDEKKQNAPQPGVAREKPPTAARPKTSDPRKPDNASGASKPKISTAAKVTSDGASDESFEAREARERVEPFVLPSKLEFTGVAGHSTTSQPLALINQRLDPTPVSLFIAGVDYTAFQVDGPKTLIVHGENDPRDPTTYVPVRFAPNRVGSLDAMLMLHHDFGDQFLPLKGLAVKGDGRVTPADGALPGVSALPDLDAGKPKKPVDMLQEAGRHVAEIGDRYNVIAPRAYKALDALKQSAKTAAENLSRRTTAWLTEEGMAEVANVEGASHTATEVSVGLKALKVLLKSVLKANPAASIAVSVTHLVASRVVAGMLAGHAKRAATKRASEGVARLKLAGKHATATDDAIGGIVEQVAALTQDLAFDLGELDALARIQAQGFVKGLPNAMLDAKSMPTSAQREYESAESTLKEYGSKEAALLASITEVEGAADRIVPSVEAGFLSLLDEYAVERRKQVVSSGADARNFAVEVSGRFDLGLEPPVLFHRLSVAGLGHASDTMTRHLAGKRLSELPDGCGALFTLTSNLYGTLTYDWSVGYLTHHRLPYSQSSREFEGMNGYERIKSALLEMKIGTGVSL